jgi:hypothetical protein
MARCKVGADQAATNHQLAERPAAKANTRPAPPEVVLELLEELW